MLLDELVLENCHQITLVDWGGSRCMLLDKLVPGELPSRALAHAQGLANAKSAHVCMRGKYFV